MKLVEAIQHIDNALDILLDNDGNIVIKEEILKDILLSVFANIKDVKALKVYDTDIHIIGEVVVMIYTIKNNSIYSINKKGNKNDRGYNY